MFTSVLRHNLQSVVLSNALFASAIGMTSIAHAQDETPPPQSATESEGEGVEEHAEENATRPPVVLFQVDAEYPVEALIERQGGTCVLRVTIGVDGTVTDVAVAESAGVLLDNAAIAAVQQWRFTPAFQAGQATAARIRIPFSFIPPTLEEIEPPPMDSSASPESAEPSTNGDGEGPEDVNSLDGIIDVTVTGERKRRTTTRSTSDFTIDRQWIQAAPRQNGVDVLRSVPGMYIGQAEGGAVAHHYTMRGFDAEHGQDIAFNVGGLPINLPAHIHGQGYADLGFLIPDVVTKVHAKEGVYDPEQGDFAVAGSMKIDLGVEERGIHLRSGYGSFHHLRETLIWAPPNQDVGTFGAVQYDKTQGFGQNRQGQDASGMLQYVSQNDGPWTFRVLGIFSGARSNLAGVVRADDVSNDTIGFYDVYPLATAQRQNAFHARAMLGGFATYDGPSGDSADIGVWMSYDTFRLQQNFTGYTLRSQRLLQVAGRGDLIEQNNRTRSIGMQGRYRTAPIRPTNWANGHIEVGMQGRIDDVDQSQNLLNASAHNQQWDQRVDAQILGYDLGFWGDLDWRFTQYLTLRAGMRADVLMYDIHDVLGNLIPAIRPQDSYIEGFRRTAYGVAWGPRTSMEIHPTPWMDILLAYGEGYRSPQARLLEDGEQAPFTKVRSSDLGMRFSWANHTQLTVGGYYTHLSDDIAFSAEEGRMERIGATRRIGALAHLQTTPTDWLIASLSMTYVYAQLLEPPPATAEEPNPPFRKGQNIPYVPPLVIRLDVAAHRILKHNAGRHDLKGRLNAGFSYLSRRPLPYGEFADAVPLLDASAGLTWGALQLDFQAFNLLNQRYAAEEYRFVSNWDPAGPPSKTPMRHTAAGAPFSWMLTLGVTL